MPAFLSVSVYEILHAFFNALATSWWLAGFLVDGVYLGLARVIAVMHPADDDLLPNIHHSGRSGLLAAHRLQYGPILQKGRSHGKQALSMSMGFGGNVAGVIAARVIDSSWERLIAILTNNFMPCNGRFPTLIMLATIFVTALFPPVFASLAAAGSLVMVVMIGVVVTLIVSAVLSRTVLKGEASSFMLELLPYTETQDSTSTVHLHHRSDNLCAVASDYLCDPSRWDYVAADRY